MGMPFFGSRKPPSEAELRRGDRTLSASKRSWVRATFREKDRRFGIGIRLGEHEQGTMVEHVTPGSPAEAQGVPVGGLVLMVAGEEVVGLPPDAVEVLIDTEMWPITIGVRKPRADDIVEAHEVDYTFGEGMLGLVLVNHAHGAVVGQVVPGSMAETCGVPTGAVVLECNREGPKLSRPNRRPLLSPHPLSFCTLLPLFSKIVGSPLKLGSRPGS